MALKKKAIEVSQRAPASIAGAERISQRPGKSQERARRRSLRLHGAIARDLGVAIVSGRYKAGDILKGEIDASDRLRVSRTAYREAVRILAAKGLVESRPKVGTKVSEPDRWHLLDPDVLSWIFEVEPDVRLVKGLFELRRIIEPEAAALAAERRTEEDLEVMAAALAGMAEQALSALAQLPARYGVALLPGTMPFAIADRGDGVPGHLNRASLLLPEGQVFHQDKLALTPSERNPAAWLLTPGAQVKIIPWLGLRVAIVICLDVEFTALFARLARLDLDLILVPAKVDLLSGYYRVLGCAKARAIELQCAVAVVGAVGSPLGQPALDTVVGAAAVFIPCEANLNVTGVVAALEPLLAMTGASPMLYAHQVPLGACRRIRHGAAEAEVWPGSWSADQITIADPAT